MADRPLSSAAFCTSCAAAIFSGDVEMTGRWMVGVRTHDRPHNEIPRGSTARSCPCLGCRRFAGYCETSFRLPRWLWVGRGEVVVAVGDDGCVAGCVKSARVAVDGSRGLDIVVDAGKWVLRCFSLQFNAQRYVDLLCPGVLFVSCRGSNVSSCG